MQDWTEILTDPRFLGAVFIAVISFIGRLLWKPISQFFQDHRETTKSIQVIMDALRDPSDPKGKKILTRSDILEGIKKLDHKCGEATCPVVSHVDRELVKMESKIDKELIDIRKTITDLCARITQTFQDFLHISEQTFGRVNSFVDEFGGSALLIIKQMIKNKNQKREDEDN